MVKTANYRLLLIRFNQYNSTFHHRVRHEQGNQLLGKFYSPFFTACKGEIHEEKLIAYDRFNMTSTNAHNLCILASTAMNQDFPIPLEQTNKMISRFLMVTPF